MVLVWDFVIVVSVRHGGETLTAPVSFPEGVMPGLVRGIHDLNHAGNKTWMAGTGPAMTKINCLESRDSGFALRAPRNDE
jgi:hypothetical protein